MRESAINSMNVILSFDVEEHNRIEAAAGLEVAEDLKSHYRGRVGESTRWLLDALAEANARATFFVVGQLAELDPKLIRNISDAGHEVASHGWDHRRVLAMSPAEFREDVRTSQDALESVTGKPVEGYRAPTFSIVQRTAWALDILAELGIKYDSSIYPVRHDRYGVASAPRGPFWASGFEHQLLELPPMTWRVARMNIPMGGGGYFRLFPLWMTRRAIGQIPKAINPPVAMLYFHPWEFDPEQSRLPLRGINRFRTYVGLGRTRRRLTALLGGYQFSRATDVADALIKAGDTLPSYCLCPSTIDDKRPMRVH